MYGIWEDIMMNGASDKIVKIIQSYYQYTQAQIQIGGELSLIFEIDFGVHQGCILPLVLLNL